MYKVDEPHCAFLNLNITILNGSTGNGCDGSAIDTRYYPMPRGENHRLSCFGLYCTTHILSCKRILNSDKHFAGEATQHFQYFPNLTFRWFFKKNGDCTSNLVKDVVVDESRNHEVIMAFFSVDCYPKA